MRTLRRLSALFTGLLVLQAGVPRVALTCASGTSVAAATSSHAKGASATAAHHASQERQHAPNDRDCHARCDLAPCRGGQHCVSAAVMTPAGSVAPEEVADAAFGARERAALSVNEAPEPPPPRG